MTVNIVNKQVVCYNIYVNLKVEKFSNSFLEMTQGGLPKMKKRNLFAEKPENERIPRVSVTGVIIPKPQKLIGGTEVYQKEGIPYWYCKIKSGRDEFMHLYTEDLYPEDLDFHKESEETNVFYNEKYEVFEKNVLEALKNKPKEGYFWLAVFEPSIDKNGNLQFVEGEEPEMNKKTFEWEKLFKNYSPENESDMASKTTYFLLLLRWLKDGIATLAEIVEFSAKIGNFWDPEKEDSFLEPTGKRSFGGLCGFVGNTHKIIKDEEVQNKYYRAGGCYLSYGYRFSVSDIRPITNSVLKFGETDRSIGLIELKK